MSKDELCERIELLEDALDEQRDKNEELMEKIDEQDQIIEDYRGLVEKLKEYLDALQDQPKKVMYKVVNVDDNERH